MCKIMTSLDLDRRRDSELSALFRKVSQELVESEPNTVKRRTALANLENISRAMASRHSRRFKPPGC